MISQFRNLKGRTISPSLTWQLLQSFPSNPGFSHLFDDDLDGRMKERDDQAGYGTINTD